MGDKEFLAKRIRALKQDENGLWTKHYYISGKKDGSFLVSAIKILVKSRDADVICGKVPTTRSNVFVSTLAAN